MCRGHSHVSLAPACTRARQTRAPGTCAGVSAASLGVTPELGPPPCQSRFSSQRTRLGRLTPNFGASGIRRPLGSVPPPGAQTPAPARAPPAPTAVTPAQCLLPWYPTSLSVCVRSPKGQVLCPLLGSPRACLCQGPPHPTLPATTMDVHEPGFPLGLEGLGESQAGVGTGLRPVPPAPFSFPVSGGPALPSKEGKVTGPALSTFRAACSKMALAYFCNISILQREGPQGGLGAKTSRELTIHSFSYFPLLASLFFQIVPWF